MDKPIVAMPFRHHASHVCEEARKMLGFNDEEKEENE